MEKQILFLFLIFPFIYSIDWSAVELFRNSISPQHLQFVSDYQGTIIGVWDEYNETTSFRQIRTVISTDDGANWSDLPLLGCFDWRCVSIDPNGPDTYPSVATDYQGNWMMSFSGIHDNSYQDIYVTRLTATGWDSPTQISSDVNNHKPSIIYTGKHWLVIWTKEYVGANGILVGSAYTLGRWVGAADIFSDGERFSSRNRDVSIATDNMGRVVMTWTGLAGLNDDILFANSSNSGDSFGSKRFLNPWPRIQTVEGDSAITYNRDRLWAAAYFTDYDRPQGNRAKRIVFSVSTDDGDNWTNSSLIDPFSYITLTSSSFTSIASDNKKVVVGWTGLSCRDCHDVLETGTSFGTVMKAADYSILTGAFDAPVVVAANLTGADTAIVRGNTSFCFFFVSGDDIMFASGTGCRHVRCNGVCVKNVSVCSARCPDTRPFPCRTDICFANPNQCTPTCQNVTCWNGRCVENSMSCDPVIACPDTFPFRCADGSCAVSASNCSNFGCPFDHVRCPDTGICVTEFSRCVSFNGCPVNQYQCADGTCSSTLSGCQCNNGNWRCADGTCSADRSLCKKSDFETKPLGVDQVISSNVQNQIDVYVDGRNSPICSVTIPRGTFDTQQVNHMIRQVPDSFLRTTRHVSWKEETTSNIKSPVLDLTADARILPNAIITITCIVSPFQVQDGNYPCLAYLVNDTWQCQSNVTVENRTSTLVVTGETTHYTSFAVILTGAPDDTSSAESEKWDRRLAYYIGFGIGGVILIVGVISVIVWNVRRKKEEELDLHPSAIYGQESNIQLVVNNK